MRERDVRTVLRAHLDVEHAADDTLVRDELGLCLGQARVDVAVINGSLSGYEIKSDRDRLDRLRDQAAVYGRVLDRVTLIAAPRHMDKASTLIPGWWGLTRVVSEDTGLRLCLERASQENPRVEPLAVAQLLWRDEAHGILEAQGGSVGMRRATRWELWRELIARLEIDELRAHVRSALRARQAWPAA